MIEAKQMGLGSEKYYAYGKNLDELDEFNDCRFNLIVSMDSLVYAEDHVEVAR